MWFNFGDLKTKFLVYIADMMLVISWGSIMHTFSNEMFKGGILNAFIFKIVDLQVNGELPIQSIFWQQPPNPPHQFCMDTQIWLQTILVHEIRHWWIFFNWYIVQHRKVSLANEHPSFGEDDQTNRGSFF